MTTADARTTNPCTPGGARLLLPLRLAGRTRRAVGLYALALLSFVALMPLDSVRADTQDTLALRGLTQTTAKLKLANGSTAWYHKSTTPAGTCSTSQTAATTVLTVRGLTPSTGYVYRAYSDSACATPITPEKSFYTRTASLYVYLVKQTTAKLEFIRGAEWWYKRTTPAGGTCTSRSATDRRVMLSSLTADTSHTYKAYSASGCAAKDEVASVSFRTLATTAVSLGRPELTVTAGNAEAVLTWTPGREGVATGWEYCHETTAPTADDCPSASWVTVSGGAATRNLTVTGLTNGQLHWFRVRGTYGTNNADKGLPSHPPAQVELQVPAGAPAKPTGLTAQVLHNDVTLRWNVRHDADRWELATKTGTGSFGAWTTIATTYGGTTRRHTVTGLADDTAYAFKVRGVNAVGNGAESDEVSRTIAPAAGVNITPTTLTIAEGASKSYAVKLTRRPGSNVTFLIKQSGDADLTANVAYLIFTPANWNTAQQVSVSARADADAADGTATFAHSVRTAAPRYEKVTAISVTANEMEHSLSASAITATGVTFTFTGPISTWYHKRTVPGGGWCSSAQLATDPPLVIQGLTANTQYTWNAYSDSGCSTSVASVDFTTPATAGQADNAAQSAPGPVTNIAVTHNGTSLSVTWDTPEGATHYDVTYSGNGASARAAWNTESTSLDITCDVRPGYEHCVDGGSSYTVGVRARNASGVSAWANSSSASLPLPGPVTGITATHLGTSLNVEWPQVSGATHYDVIYTGNGVAGRAAWNMERRTGTGNQTLSIQCDSRPEYANQHCVASGASYTVGVRARNAAGTGVWRNSASAAPPSLAVADATVAEGPSATLDFVVTLTRALPATVTVDYATSDGTATAGADYTAASGTLSFAAGQTSKTVSVTVLDDAHDEGSETLTFTLSNASGAPVSDATATGTITNDGALQRQWLSRFGRTVAGQMVEALEGRFALEADTPSHLTIAGHRVDFSGAPPTAHERREDRWEAGEAHGMDLGALLLGSSFHLTTGDALGAGAMTGWGKALAGSSSAALPGGLAFTSETVTGVLGMDVERDDLLLGFALSQSAEKGGASFASTGDEYGLEGALSLVTPYARWRANERLSLWGMAGSGAGHLAFEHRDARLRADLAMQVVAAGARADLLRPDPEAGGFALALKTDAFFVRTESESVSTPSVGNLAGATGDASRVRAVLEGSRAFALSGGGSVEPSLTLGLRHDGGDAETGTGVEMGAGLAWSDPSIGLTSDLRLYGLAAHEDASVDEWGVSGSLRIEPGTSGRGLSLSMAPTWGAQGQGGRIWDTQPSALVDEGGGKPPSARLDTELGYGFALSGGLTGTPYVGLGWGETRDYRLGWRLAAGRSQSFSLGLEAARHGAADNGAADHRIGVEGRLRW